MPALSPLPCLAPPCPPPAHKQRLGAALLLLPPLPLLPPLQLAEAELGWKATRSLHDMCADHWRWCQANPQGFLTKPTAAVAAAPAGPEGDGATAAEQ